MADYYTLLTDAGIVYETACKAAGTPIKLSQISVGDGGGAVYNPAATATALKREVWRGPLNALFQDEKNPSWLLAEVTIPPEVGGWYVREAGIWTDTGILYAIVKYPESFKPVLATSGSGKEFYIRSIFETSNAELVTLLIDDTVVKATRAWVMSYLADELAKLDGKQSVRVAATGNIVLSGAQPIDGVAVTAGQRVLLPLQTAAKENGIWVVANGAWSRAADANTTAKLAPGLTVMVEEGAKNGDSLWHLVTNGPITLDSTALTFEMLAGRTGIAPGTYKTLTVDKYGRATAGENPETLAGFGIKDTYTKPEIESLIAQASALPVGATVAFPLNKVAPGFLELDGSVKSIAVYPDLAAFLGTAFNKGDEGAGNFRLPESRGEFLRGWDHGRGVDAGRTIGSAQIGSYLPGDNNASDEIIYVHNASDKAGLGWDTFAGAPAAGVVRYHTVINESVPDPTPISLHSGAARPRNVAVMWCIKAWNAPVNQGSIDVQALATLAMPATEIHQGTAKVATQVLTDGGGDDTTIVTPKKLRWGFEILKAANGYVVFPTWLGGFIIQWGYSTIPSVSTAVPFPLSYPNACFGVQSTPFNVSGSADVVELTSLPTKTGFTVVGVSSGAAGAPVQTATSFYWLSIGH